MKKSVFAVAAACVAAACLGGCSCRNSSPSFGYDDLNGMLNASYSQVILTVTDTFEEDVSLKSVYEITYTANGATVNYTVERFSSVTDGSEGSLKTTLKGAAVISDGTVVSGNGDAAGITADIAERGISFREEFFENAALTTVSFNADVKDAGAFLGTAVTCTDMKVYATYDGAMKDIKITYTAESGNKVDCLYEFKR